MIQQQNLKGRVGLLESDNKIGKLIDVLMGTYNTQKKEWVASIHPHTDGRNRDKKKYGGLVTNHTENVR